MREARSQNVLNGFFAQVVIDAVDLLFFRHSQQLPVQKPRGFQIVSERLFDDHAAPMLGVLLHQADVGQVFHRRSEKIGRRGHVIHMIAVSGVVFVDFVEQVFQLQVKILVTHVAAQIVHAANEPFPDVGIHFAGGELA